MKKKMVIITALLILTTLVSAQDINIRVTEYPPNYYKDTNGSWTGIDVELARAIVKEAGYTPVFKARPWSRALYEMENGDLDLMMNLSKTDDRSEYMEWIGPEREAVMTLIVKEGNEKLDINSIDDLIKASKKYNKKFGIQQDLFYSKDFNDRLENDQEFAKHFESIAVVKFNSKKTTHDRILGFFEEKLSTVHNIKTTPDYKGLAVHDFNLSEEGVYFGVSKVSDKNRGIYDKLLKAFNNLEENGKLDEIRKRYNE